MDIDNNQAEIHDRLALLIEEKKVKDGLSMYKFDTITIKFAQEKRSYMYHEPIDPFTKLFVDLCLIIGKDNDLSIERLRDCTLPKLSRNKGKVCMCCLFDEWYASEPFTIDELDAIKFVRFLEVELHGIMSENINDPLSCMNFLIQKCNRNRGFTSTLRYIAIPYIKKMLDRPFGRCNICMGYYDIPYL